jgi:hypothetical protein
MRQRVVVRAHDFSNRRSLKTCAKLPGIARYGRDIVFRGMLGADKRRLLRAIPSLPTADAGRRQACLKMPSARRMKIKAAAPITAIS